MFGFMWKTFSIEILQRPRNNQLMQFLTDGQIFQEYSCKRYTYKLWDVCMQPASFVVAQLNIEKTTEAIGRFAQKF